MATKPERKELYFWGVLNVQKNSFKNYSFKKRGKTLGRLRNMRKRSPKDCSSKQRNFFLERSGRQTCKSAALKIIDPKNRAIFFGRLRNYSSEKSVCLLGRLPKQEKRSLTNHRSKIRELYLFEDTNYVSKKKEYIF